MKSPVSYYPNFCGRHYERDAMSKQLADVHLKHLLTLDWVRRDGTPRSEYYCNDIKKPYTYGRGAGQRTYEVQPWTNGLLLLKENLEDLVDCKFEVCFLNRYHDQSDQLGWHADDSPEMDDARPIATMSFGAEREIWFAPQGDKTDIDKLKLGHGSVALMAAGMQNTHFHRIPKAGFVCGERVSLTFRGYA